MSFIAHLRWALLVGARSSFAYGDSIGPVSSWMSPTTRSSGVAADAMAAGWPNPPAGGKSLAEGAWARERTACTLRGMQTRREKDTMGWIEVPAEHLWGAQTQRSLHHF